MSNIKVVVIHSNALTPEIFNRKQSFDTQIYFYEKTLMQQLRINMQVLIFKTFCEKAQTVTSTGLKNQNLAHKHFSLNEVLVPVWISLLVNRNIHKLLN